MSATAISIDTEYTRVAIKLDLPYTSDRDEQIRLLRERRDDQLAALAHPAPAAGWSASMLRLRVTRLDEIRELEGVLFLAGVPFEEEAE